MTKKLTLAIVLITVLLGLCVWTLVLGARIKARSQIHVPDPPADGRSSIPYSIPEGMRAFVINSDELDGQLSTPRPGDRVNILATYTETNTHQETTQTILQNVLVLAAVQNRSVTLAVKAEEAELLTATGTAAELRVTNLRAP